MLRVAANLLNEQSRATDSRFSQVETSLCRVEE